MAKYSIAVVIGCLYVALSAWIVRSAGDAYRRDLLREREARRESNAKHPQLAKDPVEAKSGSAATATPLLPSSDSVASKPSPATAPSPPPAASPDTREKSIASASPVSPAPKHAMSRPMPKPEPAPPADSPPEPPDPGVIWADTLNLGQAKPEDERRLGRELYKLIMKYSRPLDTGAYDQRLEDAARPLLAKRARKEIDYTFTVLDSSAVNAFSHPGGYIYVSQGLFNLIGEDEDYALEFVLGHEIAHVDLKHAFQCIEPVNVEEKKRGLGTLPQFYLLIAYGYPDKMEAEADTWVYRRMMLDLDRSRHDALAFLRKFEGYARQNGFASGRKLPPEKAEHPGEALPSMVDNHFRALTAARKRLNDLKALSGDG